MKLYHMTSIENAVKILHQQAMHPGNHGLCGPGIYFGADPTKLHLKAHSQGVTLCAEVDLGKVMLAKKENCFQGENWAERLDRRGCDSVRCTGISSGDEYIVYDAYRVRSIEFIDSTKHLFTGQLNISADGTAGTGWSFQNYEVRISKIHQTHSWPFPVLLKDAHSDMLGWVAPESLRVIS
jgi:hypothetical protein